MSGPIRDSDQLFALYSKYQKQIEKNEVEILIDRETQAPTIIEKKTDEKSLDIFQKIEIWFRTALRLDRKIEKELVKMMDKEFKAMEKETNELSKKITEEVKDEALSEEINEKVTATLSKLEEHKKQLPSIKEKYSKPWEDITKKSSDLGTYGKLIGQKNQIDKAKTPQEKIRAINEFFATFVTDASSKINDAALQAKFSASIENLNLNEIKDKSTNELHKEIDLELNGLEEVFIEHTKELLEKPLKDIEDPLKGLKEKIAFLENNDENKLKYEAKVKEFEERLKIDNVTINNARQMVSKWETTKADFGREPINLPQLTNFIDDANQVFNSPLGPAVKEKIGKDIAETIQSVQTKLLEANQKVTETIQKNNKTLETLEKGTESMKKMIAMSRESGKEQLKKLGYETPKSFQEIEKLLTEKEKTVNDLKTKSGQLQEMLQEIEQEPGNMEASKEKILQDYMKEDKTLQGFKQNEGPDKEVLVTKREQALRKEFNRKYEIYQQRYKQSIDSIQQEIERHKINRDPETIKLEEFSTLYNLEEQLLKTQNERMQKEATEKSLSETFLENLINVFSKEKSQKETATTFSEGLINLSDKVEKNKLNAPKLKIAIEKRDGMQRDDTLKQIRAQASLEKMEKNRPQRLEEAKVRAEEAKQHYEMVSKEAEELKKAVKEFKDAEEAEKTISFNEKMTTQLKPQIKSQNEPLQRTAEQQSTALEKLNSLKLA